VPITEIWNNSSDCHELIATLPFSKEEIRKAGFPSECDFLIEDTSNYISKLCIALPAYRKLSTSINDAIRSESYALVRETPEDEEYRNQRFFLSFGANYEKGWSEYPVSIRLGLNSPDWNSLKKKLGFIPGKSFVNFVESFPGLVIHHIEYPEFILPAEYFAKVSELLPQESDGKIAIPKDKLSMLENYMLFQCDYWSVYRFIGKNDIVYELKTSPFSFTCAGINFEKWVSEKMEKWNEPESKPNT